MLRKRLLSAPSGSITGKRDGNRTRWFLSEKTDGKTSRRYISKSERDLAELLVKKKLDECMLEDNARKHKAIAAAIESYEPEASKCIGFQKRHPVFNEFYEALAEEKDRKMAAWVAAGQPANDLYTAALRHTTDRGDVVRSKSEAMIANALYSRNISYRYECLLQQDMSFYPDFTIIHSD